MSWFPLHPWRIFLWDLRLCVGSFLLLALEIPYSHYFFVFIPSLSLWGLITWMLDLLLESDRFLNLCELIFSLFSLFCLTVVLYYSTRFYIHSTFHFDYCIFQFQTFNLALLYVLFLYGGKKKPFLYWDSWLFFTCFGHICKCSLGFLQYLFLSSLSSPCWHPLRFSWFLLWVTFMET